MAQRGSRRALGQGAPRAPGRDRGARDRTRRKAHRLDLEAAPIVHISDPALHEAVQGLDLAELCITSALDVRDSEGPIDAFRLDEVKGVAVVSSRASGRKCARSWKVTPDVGTDVEYPDVTPRDAQALRELGVTLA